MRHVSLADSKTIGQTTSVSDADVPQYVLLGIENAHLCKNHQALGVGKMDPFVILSINKKPPSMTSFTEVTRTPTHWDSHFEPAWFHECPRFQVVETAVGEEEDHGESSCYSKTTLLRFVVYNDSKLGALRRVEMAHCQLTVSDLLQHYQQAVKASKNASLGLDTSLGVGRLLLPLSDDNGTLTVEVRVRDAMSLRRTIPGSMALVDPSWFETPVTRVGVSGGTAPFFNLILTDEGMQATGHASSPSYYIGKDLSHAEDERDFYEKMLQLKTNGEESQKGVGLMTPFLLDYLGILETKTTSDDGKIYQLLVMQNLRNDYQTFRMLDLKMGQQTAQGGWQGKSRLRAMKQAVLDGMTNSSLEGYRLEGFDGCPPRLESMDPLLDILAMPRRPSENPEESSHDATPKTLWGKPISEKAAKMARRILLQNLRGAQIFRLLIDVHLDQQQPSVDDMHKQYLPVEVAEIVLHELVCNLIRLAVTCGRLQVPQKWLGSSVALGFDCGLYPSRTPGGESEHAIRSKVITNVFDWGRSELLTQRRYQRMTEAEHADRQRFWENYKNGIYRLTYNATREYYHHFTNCGQWTELIVKVMDFDSMKPDDYMGQVVISLPDQSDSDAVEGLRGSHAYDLRGCADHSGKTCGTVYCSISWLEFPPGSRLRGSWRITIERATDLPAKDLSTGTSDPYCIVTARDACNHRQVSQMTCVKPRSLNPQWNETIDVPVMRDSSSDLSHALNAEGVEWDWSHSDEITDKEMAHLFQFHPPDENLLVREWSARLRFSH
jgi:C2 domain